MREIIKLFNKAVFFIGFIALIGFSNSKMMGHSVTIENNTSNKFNLEIEGAVSGCGTKHWKGELKAGTSSAPEKITELDFGMCGHNKDGSVSCWQYLNISFINGEQKKTTLPVHAPGCGAITVTLQNKMVEESPVVEVTWQYEGSISGSKNLKAEEYQ
jgi:hypothetical protein